MSYTSKFNVKHDYFVKGINVKFGAFTLYFDAEVVDSFEIKSGLWGKGALPYGLYHLGAPRILPDILGNNSFKRETDPWLCVLTPQFETDRTDLCLHPDGGVEGTLGCMGIQKRDSRCLYVLQEIFKKVEFIPLSVEKFAA